jgi:hypothetical protein
MELGGFDPWKIDEYNNNFCMQPPIYLVNNDESPNQMFQHVITR